MAKYSGNKVVLRLISCVRCNKTHTNLVFSAFTYPPNVGKTTPVYTHFCLCPTNNEPILLLDE